jgi:hypothetical protein
MRYLKNYLLMAVIMLTASVAFTACGGDDNDDSGNAKNIMKVNNTYYKITTVAIFSEIFANNSVAVLCFLGKGLTYNASEDEFSGKGPVLELGPMASDNPMSTLTSGSFASLVGGTWCPIFDSDNESDENNETREVTGNINISKNGGIYTITFTGKVGSDDVKLNYKGKVLFKNNNL